eukprot:2840016-Pyramimonas_sp.AAC.1
MRNYGDYTNHSERGNRPPARKLVRQPKTVESVSHDDYEDYRPGRIARALLFLRICPKPPARPPRPPPGENGYQRAYGFSLEGGSKAGALHSP